MVTYPADAKSFDKEAEIILKGDGVLIQTSQINLQVITKPNSDTLSVTYVAEIVDEDDNVTLDFGFFCDASDKILKLSALKKGSLEFNTADLVNCLFQSENNGDIIITMQTNGSLNFLKWDNRFCTPPDGDGIKLCSRERGTSDGASGTASGTYFGQVLEEGTLVNIGKINEKRTIWTEH